ncbi:MAG TPA: cysteine desulfurase [Epulopiscium sp.]|nr:cysteine desulfurase [Candidatus Epulonipiscium sp.]
MIYLDNGATTQPLPIVAETMMKVMLEDYGNPSSYHTMGLTAEKHIKQASEYFSKVLQCTPDEIIYTSGGTEANNMAIIGTALAYNRTGKRIITTKIEHASVHEAFKYLEEQGFEVIYLSVDARGYIDLDELVSSINDETTLVSIMHVNNELGTVQDIKAIGQKIKEKNKNTLFHVDGIQSFTKVQINRRSSQIDLLSVSSHKIYGPKGVGLLYKNKNTKMNALLFGGGQQKGYRSGTQNVPGIVGMHIAAQEIMGRFDEHAATISALKQDLANSTLSTIEGTYINGPKVQDGAPHILNIGFENIKAEVLLHALEAAKIYVSSGSACSSNKKVTNSVLQAIGKNKEQLDQAIRFSFGINNTQDQMDETVLVLQKTIPMLRQVLSLGGRRR